MAEKDLGGKFLIDRDPTGWVRWLLGDFDLTVTEILTPEFQFVGRRSDSLLKVEGPNGSFGALSELQLEPQVEMPAGCKTTRRWAGKSLASLSCRLSFT